MIGSLGTESALSRVIAFCRSNFAISPSASSPSLPTSGAGSTEHRSRTTGTGTSLPSEKSAEPIRDEGGRFVSRARMEAIEKAREIRAAFPNRKWKTPL